ncbi:MAG: DUF779 domain-containing protein [Janthinobacterium lividum]
MDADPGTSAPTLASIGGPGGANEADGANEAVARVVATPAALELLARLGETHGALLFHQSGGCCDGSAPMCFPATDFLVGSADVRLGDIGGVPFYMGAAQFAYWAHTQLIIDIVQGNGGMFSVERPTGWRFITRSRLFDAREGAWLALHPVETVA